MIFDWNDEKNDYLIRNRDISFEEIIRCIESGNLLDDIQHPNTHQYAHQRIFIVWVADDIFVVPYVQKNDSVFLKTAYKSRKLMSGTTSSPNANLLALSLAA